MFPFVGYRDVDQTMKYDRADLILWMDFGYRPCLLDSADD